MKIRQTLLNLITANGASNPMMITDYVNAVFDIITTGSTTAVIKFVISNEDTVDFGSSSVVGNEWKTIQTINLEDGASIDGDTGLVLSGTDMQRALEANVNGARWIGVIVSGYSAGTINAVATAFNPYK